MGVRNFLNRAAIICVILARPRNYGAQSVVSDAEFSPTQLRYSCDDMWRPI